MRNRLCKNIFVKIIFAKQNDAPKTNLFVRFGASRKTNQSQLPVVIVLIVRSLLVVVHVVHRSRLTEASSVALAGVRRFELRLLTGRNEMRVFFQILDDFFADYLAFESAQRAFD